MVVLLVNKFFFEKGGSERYFFMQSDALAERGHRVVHFSMQHPANRPSPWVGHFVSNRNYDDAGSAAALRAGASFIRSREAAERVDALVAEAGVEVAHLHNVYHQITPSIIPVLRRRGIPVFMTLHDYKLVCPNYTLFAHGRYCERCLGGRFHHAAIMRCHRRSFVRSTMLAVEAYWQKLSAVYDGVHTFLAPSRYMRDTFVRAGFAPVRVRYLPSFLPEPAVLDPSMALPTLPESYLLYFGRLSEEKGLRTLLAAVGERPHVHLVLCGDGPQRPELEAMVARANLDNVHFAGYLDKARLDVVVSRARAAVLPAEWPENAPFAVLEAAQQGIPVIVSDMGGLPEMARIVGGRVFENGNRAALGAAIDAVWSAPEEARARAGAGRAALAEHYDRERHLAALETLYADALAGVAA